MLCAAPKFLLLIGMSAAGPQYREVPKDALKPEIQKLDNPQMHAECRRRQIGDCLSQIRLNPNNGHISFLCNRLPRAETKDGKDSKDG